MASALGTKVTGANSAFVEWYDSQAETVVNVSSLSTGRVVSVSFNDETNCAHGGVDLIQYPTTSTRRVFTGASLMGWAHSTDDGASFSHHCPLAPPAGWSVLWGDPAIAKSPLDNNYVFLANVAVPSAKMPSTGYIDGPLSSAIGGACIARSTDGGVSFANYVCLSNTDAPNTTGHFYDGTALTVNNSGEVFFASFDVDREKYDVWKAPSVTSTSFVRLPDPFPGFAMSEHPRLRSAVFSGGRVYVIGREKSSGQLLGSYYENGVWSTLRGVSDSSKPVTTADIVFGSGMHVRTATQYSCSVGASSTVGYDAIRCAYTTKNQTSGKASIRVSHCDLDLNCGDIESTNFWTTESATGDAFHPVLTSYSDAYGAQWRLFFQSRSSNATGNVVRPATTTLTTLSGSRYLSTNSYLADQSPCADLRGYWGDYNGGAYLSGNGAAPKFITAFTDSTNGCDPPQTYTAHHQHVSVWSP